MKPYMPVAAPLLCALLSFAGPGVAAAQVPPTAAADQRALLASPDPKLARNKQHVYDFWRIVYEGGHVERAAEFMAEGYIQHNPNLPSGRATFVEYFRKARPARPVADRIKMPVIHIMAEGDLVTVTHVRKLRDTANPQRIYSITWYDTFRIDAQGLIAEHWDPSPLWVNGAPPGAEFFSEWDR